MKKQGQILSVFILAVILSACQTQDNLASRGETDDLYYVPSDREKNISASNSQAGYDALLNEDNSTSGNYYDDSSSKSNSHNDEVSDADYYGEDDYYDQNYSQRLNRFHGSYAPYAYSPSPSWNIGIGMGMGMPSSYFGGWSSFGFGMSYGYPAYNPWYDPFWGYRPYSPFYRPWGMGFGYGYGSYMSGYWNGFHHGLHAGGYPYGGYYPGVVIIDNGSGYGGSGRYYGPRNTGGVGQTNMGGSNMNTPREGTKSLENNRSKDIATPRSPRSLENSSREGSPQGVRDIYSRDVRTTTPGRMETTPGRMERTPSGTMNRGTQPIDYRKPRPAGQRNIYSTPTPQQRNIQTRPPQRQQQSSPGRLFNPPAQQRQQQTAPQPNRSRSVPSASPSRSGGSSSPVGGGSNGGARSPRR